MAGYFCTILGDRVFEDVAAPEVELQIHDTVLRLIEEVLL
jgi:hypothetical protein